MSSIFTADGFRRLQAEADAYAREFGFIGDRNGDADAFRHAYTSAEVARTNGSAIAEILGTGYEI